MEICKKCGSEKNGRCKVCLAAYKKQWQIDNKERLSNKSKIYYVNNKEHIIDKAKSYNANNKDKKKIYDKGRRLKNKEKLSLQAKEYYINNKGAAIERNRKLSNIKYKNEPLFKLKNRLSSEIRRALISNNTSKKGHSILKYLPYNMKELKAHIEKQFETWMNWQNWGQYKVSIWNDNDQSTWTWQIDHIIPQYDLQYVSMEDDNFKKCWSLSNLRPYSAKQNIIDGVNRTRHEKRRK